jgi:LysR family hydrogen peroxide-inducible transcriptional activator
MNIRDLEYFVTVHQEGHFGRAAHRCFVSQPTLSGQLKKLEEELGMPLFDRTTRALKLSDFGQEILPMATAILEQIQAIELSAQSHKDPSVGIVHFGVFPSLAAGLFPQVAPFLNQAAPKSSFLFHEEKSNVLIEKLMQKELDLAFLAAPDGEPLFETSSKIFEPFWLLCSKNHPLAHQKSVTLADLDGQEILLLDDGHCLRGQVQDLCTRFGGNQNQSYRGTSLETLKQAVRVEIGITLVPAMSVPQTAEDQLKYIPFLGESPGRYLHLCWRKTHPKAEFFRTLAGEILAGLNSFE